MEEKKHNCYTMILYKDSTSYNYNKIIEYIEKYIDRYAYIEHKKEEENAKDHTHVILYFNNKRYINSVAKEFSSTPVDLNLVACKLVPMLRYLIHYDDEDKIQYKIEDVKGPLSDKLKSIINGGNNDKEHLNDIIKFIYDLDYVSYQSIFIYCLNMEYFSTYLRYYAVIRDIINEHNSFLTHKK